MLSDKGLDRREQDSSETARGCGCLVGNALGVGMVIASAALSLVSWWLVAVRLAPVSHMIRALPPGVAAVVLALILIAVWQIFLGASWLRLGDFLLLSVEPETARGRFILGAFVDAARRSRWR